MTRLIATVLCLLLVLYLFRNSKSGQSKVSNAIWIPSFWIFIAASRNIAQWLHYSPESQGDRYLEGNPLDRAILTAVMAIGLVVLIRRSQQVSKILQSNLPIILFFLYCAISALWSDFPDVSIKRWFRALGDVEMALILLTEQDWQAAFRCLVSRLAFIIMPVSVLFIRYYPELGRAYTQTGIPEWTGVGTDKNALGMNCLLFGVGSLFFFVRLFREDSRKNKKSLFAYAIVLCFTLFLLWEAKSATALACFFLASGTMLITEYTDKARNPLFLNFLVLVVILVPFSAMFLGIGSSLVQGLGRDATFTGRTAIWHYAPTMVSNPLVGEGYESFWLGHRLEQMKILLNQGINQAHNGYIEIYLNLGYFGLLLLGFLLLTGYFRIAQAARSRTNLGGLRLAYFIIGVAYNFSEGGFKMMHPVWIILLISIAAIPHAMDHTSPQPKMRIGQQPKPKMARNARSKPEADVLITKFGFPCSAPGSART